MDLEILILSELSQTEKQRKRMSYDISYTWNLKISNTNELIYKTDTDSQTQRMNLWSSGWKDGGKGSQGVFNQHVHTAIFKMDNQYNRS